MNDSGSCMSSVVVDKHVHNQSRRLKPNPHKHAEPDEYLEYLNINNYSNSRDYDGRTQTTYTEHREYIKITHAKDQIKGTMQTAVEKTNASKQVDVPAGSKIFGGFIIPPFFSLSRNNTKDDNDPPQSSGNFLSKMLNKLIASPTKVNEGEVDEVIGQRLSIWEERKKAGAFLDSYLRDCVSKESSVFSPEEKVEMKRIQDILIREKEEEREREREAKAKKDEEALRIERQKKKTVARKERKEEESLRRKNLRDDDDVEREMTLGTVLSGEHPLFARKFREKVRIFTKSGTEVNVDKNGVSVMDDRSSNGSQLEVTDGTIDLVQAIREENKKTRQILKRVYSSEADWCSSTIEPKNPNSHQIDLTGDVEVEFSHKVMEENHKILHKLQVDQAKEIQLNKIIIKENKRTLKKLKMEQEKEKLRQSVNNNNNKIKKTPSGRFLKERKKLPRKKSKCSNIETSVCSNTNLEKEFGENKTTSESEKIVKRQPKKKAWSTEMLSKKEKAQQTRKKERRNESNLDRLRDYNNKHSSKNAEAAARRKPNELKEFSLEKENNTQVISNVEEERNFDGIKVIPRNKHVKKLEIKKSPQGDICIPGSNVVRKKWEGPNESEIDEYQYDIHHGQLCQMQETQSVEDFLMVENQRSTFQYCNSSRDNTEYGPSTIESMIQGMKEAGLTRSFVPMKRKPLDDCLLYDQLECTSEENVRTREIRTHATNGKEVFYLFQKCNGCYENIYCQDDEISQHVKSPCISGEEFKVSSCEQRNVISKTRKRHVTKRRKRIVHSVENTTSKESMAKSIQVRDEAIKERRQYISNRRKKAHGCGDGHPVESTNRMDARKIAQDACLQTYEEVQNKLRLLGKVLKEGEIVKRSKQVKQSDYSLMAKFQGALKDKFCKKRFPKDQILKFNCEKDSVCVPSITRSKRAGLVVSKRKMGFNCRSSHKDNHLRNKERKHKIHDTFCNQSHQEKALCMTPDALNNLMKSENRRRRKLNESKGNEDERKLVESTKMERKSKLIELLNKVNRKTATYSLLSHLIEQDQYYSDSSEDDLVPDLRQGKEKKDNDSKYRLMLIEKPKGSTSGERVITAKRRRTSSKLNDRRSRHIMDLETKVIYKRKSHNQPNTNGHQRLASLDTVELHKNLPHLESETKVYYVRESSNEKKIKKKNRSGPDEEISDKDLASLEPETKVVHKRESSHQNQRKNQKKNRASPDEGISEKDHTTLEPETKFLHKSESSHPKKTKSRKLVTPVNAVDSHKDLPHSEAESKVHHNIGKSSHRISKSHKRVASLDKDHLKSNTSHHEVNVAQDESKKQRGMKGNRARGSHDSDASRHRDGRSSKRRERSKRDREQTLNGSTDIIFKRDGKENNLRAETNAAQEDTILLHKTSYEPSDQLGSIPNNVRSKKMVEHMSNVLSEYLATNRQNKQTEDVDGQKRKKEHQGDVELREAVEKVQHPKQSEQENEGWKKDKETSETGIVTKGRKNREVVHLSTSFSRNHIIKKHKEECVEEFDHFLSTTDKHKEHFDRPVKNADVKDKISETNTKCDEGDGIVLSVFARHPAQMSSGKSENICPSGSTENDKNVASRSHKGVKVLEPKSDASKGCKGNNNDIQPGGSSKKRERDPNGHSIKKVDKGYVIKKASSLLKDKMSGHIVLNNEDFDNAAGDVLKKGERSEEGQKSFDEEDHIPPWNIAELIEKCAICMTPDSSVKSQCSAMVHEEVTSQLNEKLNRPESYEKIKKFESEVYLHGNGDSKCKGKAICEISSDDNIIDCSIDATSCDCETLNVISCLDTPDKAINEIFKKMDDVIINRFLTLASNNGITIVVTPKVVWTSESNDDTERKPEEFSKEGFEVNAHNTNKVIEKSNEEPMNDTEVSDTNNNVNHHIGMVYDETTESYKNEQEYIIGHQSKDCDPIEFQSAVNDKSFVNKIESVVSNQESQVKSAWKPSSKKTAVSRQYKNNLYFISQTFCKNSEAMRRNKKFRMRLPRNKTTQTGSKVRKMANWYQSEQERIEQQVTEGQQVVVDATSPDYNGPEDMLKGRIYYDHCYEQVLHCLPSHKQVEVNDDRECKKQKDFPVDQLLETIRSNLDEDEMELLDAASRSTINVLSERRKFKTSDGGLNLLFCKDNYTNLSSTSSMVPNIKTIEEVIAEADSNDNLVSICECFGVDTIDDLMDHLKSISSNDAVEQIQSTYDKKKCNKKHKRNNRHKKNMKNDKVIDAKESPRKRINRNGVGMIDGHSKIHSKDVYVDSWYCTTNGEHPQPKESFEFRDISHCEHPKINAINKWIKTGELENRESAREKETGIFQFPNKKKMQKDEYYELYSKDINGDACFSLSSFIHNYALKSGIIFADMSSTTLAKDCTSEEPDTDDVLKVKIQLNEDGSKKKTSIVIEVPESQDFVLANKMYKGTSSLMQAPPSPLHSSAQIVHVDSEEIVLSTDLPEVPEWTTEQEEAFQKALKKHPPTLKVWDRIATSVGRSKKDCVLHFMAIWRRLDTTSV